MKIPFPFCVFIVLKDVLSNCSTGPLSNETGLYCVTKVLWYWFSCISTVSNNISKNQQFRCNYNIRILSFHSNRIQLVYIYSWSIFMIYLSFTLFFCIILKEKMYLVVTFRSVSPSDLNGTCVSIKILFLFWLQ